MRRRPVFHLAAIALAAGVPLAAPAAAQAQQARHAQHVPSAKEILAAAQPHEFRALPQDELLYMTLAHDHRVIIELAPAWAPQHVANIKTLVGEHYFDDTSVYRVQDNFVAQWGDPDGDKPKKAKSMGSARTSLPPEFTRRLDATLQASITPLPDGDVYAPHVGFVRGLPMAWNTKTGKAWLVQCYGMVGVARDVDPTSGNGNTLYVPIGQAPRRIDRQLAVVGRVVRGMQWLSSLPRGPKPMGVYKDPARRTPILSVRLGSALPADQQVQLKVLRTDSPSFRKLIESARKRRSAFYTQAVGHVGICGLSQPVRALH